MSTKSAIRNNISLLLMTTLLSSVVISNVRASDSNGTSQSVKVYKMGGLDSNTRQAGHKKMMQENLAKAIKDNDPKAIDDAQGELAAHAELEKQQAAAADIAKKVEQDAKATSQAPTMFPGRQAAAAEEFKKQAAASNEAKAVDFKEWKYKLLKSNAESGREAAVKKFEDYKKQFPEDAKNFEIKSGNLTKAEPTNTGGMFTKGRHAAIAEYQAQEAAKAEEATKAADDTQSTLHHEVNLVEDVVDNKPGAKEALAEYKANLLEQKNRSKSLDLFEDVINQKPGSKERLDAEAKLAEFKKQLTAQSAASDAKGIENDAQADKSIENIASKAASDAESKPLTEFQKKRAMFNNNSKASATDNRDAKIASSAKKEGQSVTDSSAGKSAKSSKMSAIRKKFESNNSSSSSGTTININQAEKGASDTENVASNTGKTLNQVEKDSSTAGSSSAGGLLNDVEKVTESAEEIL